MADITRGINSAILYVALNGQATGDIISAPSATQKIRVWSLFGSIDVDGSMQFKSGSGATVRTGDMTLKAGGGFGMSAGIVPLFEGGAGEKLTIVMTTGTFDGVLGYTIEAV